MGEPPWQATFLPSPLGEGPGVRVYLFTTFESSGTSSLSFIP